MDVIIQKLLGTHIQQSQLLLLFCPPKVGSTTIVTSVRISASETYLVLHLHDDNILRHFDKDIETKVYVNGLQSLMELFIEELSKLFTKVVVMDIYRNSFDRIVSEYFENLQKLHFNNT